MNSQISEKLEKVEKSEKSQRSKTPNKTKSKTTKTKLTPAKSKKKIIEEPIYELSLNFSNNLLQTYLFDIFEKFKINLSPIEINYSNIQMSNLIRINYNQEVYFLIFLNKEILKTNFLFESLEVLLKITLSRNITYVLVEIPNNFKLKFENEEISLEELIFFLNCEMKVKTALCSGNNDLVEFLANFCESLTKKEDKSKITFFDAKPVTSTNLCELENITDDKTIMFVKHLMCIPGISERKAIAVVKVYPYLSELMRVYCSEEYTEHEKENLLKDMEVEDHAKNTVKRLGGVLSSKIYKTFNTNNPNLIIN
jgi:hypothetical protein